MMPDDPALELVACTRYPDSLPFSSRLARRGQAHHTGFSLPKWPRLRGQVMPPELQILMRHESIETTLRYYVETDAQSTAASLWAAFERSGGPKPSPAPNNSSNILAGNALLPDGVTVAQGILVPFV
jgi:hypothetical protein